MIHWHYTPAMNMVKILASRHIAPSTVDIARTEIAATWFSKDQHWERTAAECAIPRIGHDPMTVRTADGQAILGIGLYRLGMPDARTAPYPRCCRQLGIPQRRVRILNEKARLVGATPSDWSAIAGPVSLDDPDLVFSYRRDRAWHDAPLSDVLDVMAENHRHYAPMTSAAMNGIMPEWAFERA